MQKLQLEMNGYPKFNKQTTFLQFCTLHFHNYYIGHKLFHITEIGSKYYIKIIWTANFKKKKIPALTIFHFLFFLYYLQSFCMTFTSNTELKFFLKVPMIEK